MTCQYCKGREAEHSFIIQFQNGRREIHLCSECAEMAQRYYKMALQAYGGTRRKDFSPIDESRQLGESPFPADAGNTMRSRRRLNALKARLAEAVRLEHYEEAARLRDKIAEAEKDVYAL